MSNTSHDDRRAKRKENLVSTAAAVEALGISYAQFHRIVKGRRIEPDGTYVNPNYRSGPPAHLLVTQDDRSPASHQ